MIERESWPNSHVVEPERVVGEFHYAAAHGRVLRSIKRRSSRAAAHQYMVSKGWLQPFARFYLQLTSEGWDEYRRRKLDRAEVPPENLPNPPLAERGFGV